MESGKLKIEGNYELTYAGKGKLQMTHEEDYVQVHGNVQYNPYSGGSLSAGTFELTFVPHLASKLLFKSLLLFII